jgi:hypothetical protein
MLRHAGLGLAVIALSAVIASPSYADVLPVKRASKGGERAKVAERMQQLGVPAPEATAKAAKMASQDVAYFAGNDERMQVSAGLWSEEWLIGGGAVLALGVLAYIVIDDASHE